MRLSKSEDGLSSELTIERDDNIRSNIHFNDGAITIYMDGNRCADLRDELNKFFPPEQYKTNLPEVSCLRKMLIIKSPVKDLCTLEFYPDGSDEVDFSLDHTLQVSMSNERFIILRNELNKLFPSEIDLPEEPKEWGYYRTQQNVLLYVNADGWWYAPSANASAHRGFWNPGTYASWGTVYRKFGADAFPLVPLAVEENPRN